MNNITQVCIPGPVTVSVIGSGIDVKIEMDEGRVLEVKTGAVRHVNDDRVESTSMDVPMGENSQHNQEIDAVDLAGGNTATNLALPAMGGSRSISPDPARNINYPGYQSPAIYGSGCETAINSLPHLLTTPMNFVIPNKGIGKGNEGSATPANFQKPSKMQ